MKADFASYATPFCAVHELENNCCSHIIIMKGILTTAFQSALWDMRSLSIQDVLVLHGFLGGSGVGDCDVSFVLFIKRLHS